MFPTRYYPRVYFALPYWERPPAFSTVTIGPVLAVQDATDLHLSWTAAEPRGSVFQVYANRRLVWHGRERAVTIPVPDGLASIQVGTVAAIDENTDFSAQLPLLGGTGDRAKLTWYGGTYLDPTGQDDIAGFHVYGSTSRGAPVSYSTPLATLASYPGGILNDGFGQGEFGRGGFGRSASFYTWISGKLTTGVWKFVVHPFDAAGNEKGSVVGGTFFPPRYFASRYHTPNYWAGGIDEGSTISVTVSTRPRPPSANVNGLRLAYSYNPASHVATLSWLASAG